jgi:hypothetical protein
MPNPSTFLKAILFIGLLLPAGLAMGANQVQPQNTSALNCASENLAAQELSDMTTRSSFVQNIGHIVQAGSATGEAQAQAEAPNRSPLTCVIVTHPPGWWDRNFGQSRSYYDVYIRSAYGWNSFSREAEGLTEQQALRMARQLARARKCRDQIERALYGQF